MKKSLKSLYLIDLIGLQKIIKGYIMSMDWEKIKMKTVLIIKF